MNKAINYDEKSVYRFHYVHFGKIGEAYGIGANELIDWTYTPFKLPDNFSVNEAFYLLSYLIQKIEDELQLPECSQKALTVLNNNLALFGFKLLPGVSGKTVDLYTVSGNLRKFNKSEFSKEYFEWFKPGFCLEEIQFICNKNKLEFKDICFTGEKI